MRLDSLPAGLRGLTPLVLEVPSGLRLVVIDYLQLMQAEHPTSNRVQEVSEISRGLKALARELSVPVIALSQLSRQPEMRESKEPRLSDLDQLQTIAGGYPDRAAFLTALALGPEAEAAAAEPSAPEIMEAETWSSPETIDDGSDHRCRPRRRCTAGERRGGRHVVFTPARRCPRT